MVEKEASLQRRCQAIFEKNKAFVFKTHADMYTRVGIPDLIACLPVTEDNLKKMLDDGWFKDNKIGIFVGIETKTVGQLNVFDYRRKAQEIVGREIKNAGGIWFAIDDSDIIEAIIKTSKGEL